MLRTDNAASPREESDDEDEPMDKPSITLLPDGARVDKEFEAFLTIEPDSKFTLGTANEVKYTALESFTVVLVLSIKLE